MGVGTTWACEIGTSRELTTTDPEIRQRLIAQAEHLIDEIDALEPLVGHLPDEILSSRPLTSEPSIKEFYALLGLYDRHVYLPAIRAIQEEDAPMLTEADDAHLLARRAWHEMPFSAVLDTLRDARGELVDVLKALPGPGWSRNARLGKRNMTVYDVVYGLVQHDAELLRSVAMRLHDIQALGFSPEEKTTGDGSNA